MVILLLKLILITSLLVLGWTIVSQPSMAFGWVREWASKKIRDGYVVYEAFFNCHWCQPSIWSLFGFAFAFGLGILENFSWKLVVLYPLVVAGSSLTCGLIWVFYKKLEAEHKYFTNAEKLAYMEIKERKEEYNKKRNR